MNIFGDSSDSEVEPFSEDFVPPAPRLEARITETTFDGLLQKPLRLHEDLARGCGGMIWPAGNLLAKYVLRNYNAESLAGKRIVELGAGGGLVGLAVAQQFQGSNFELFITDQEPMMDLMRRNTELNGLKNVTVELYDWGTPVPETIANKSVDIVLAADCVYFEPAFPLLEQTLIDLVTENNVVLFCYKKRRKADTRFIKAIQKRLRCVEIKDYPEYTEYSKESIHLYTMTKKP